MYRKSKQPELPPEEFIFYTEIKLAPDNRWVILASLIPWEEFEDEYIQNFSVEMGAPALSWRMALGALIIKEKLGITDRETVEQIKENPYLQYFIGLKAFSNEAPFDPSMMVLFRERISAELVNKVNKKVVEEERKKSSVSQEADQVVPRAEDGSRNRGQLILDATCSPADIRYPTDLNLLNQAREQTEKIMDVLYKTITDKIVKKPRTYRKQARKDYLAVAKQRRPLLKTRRKGIKKQLQYIKRNLGHIQQLIEAGARLESLSKQQYKLLLVITEVYRQQLWMWSNKAKRIDDRIVSLNQPHIRPIIRGKAGCNVEFGAKISASCWDGYVFIHQINWDNFNESGDFIAQIEAYKEYIGTYPESVHVDKIYRTRRNRAFCKEKGIRISGPPLGRPPASVSSEIKKQALEDERIRNQIEGKFGQGKRRFTLNRVMTKLSHTSETAIAITFLVMNLSTILKRLLIVFFCQFFKIISSFRYLINQTNIYSIAA